LPTSRRRVLSSIPGLVNVIFLVDKLALHKTSGKTKNKMGGRRPEGHITDPKNTRIENTSRRQRRMGASSEGGQAPKGAVAPYMEWKWNGK
jgi:hypothetical protein